MDLIHHWHHSFATRLETNKSVAITDPNPDPGILQHAPTHLPPSVGVPGPARTAKISANAGPRQPLLLVRQSPFLSHSRGSSEIFTRPFLLRGSRGGYGQEGWGKLHWSFVLNRFEGANSTLLSYARIDWMIIISIYDYLEGLIG